MNCFYAVFESANFVRKSKIVNKIRKNIMLSFSKDR
jgi:hypothetical protein